MGPTLICEKHIPSEICTGIISLQFENATSMVSKRMFWWWQQKIRQLYATNMVSKQVLKHLKDDKEREKQKSLLLLLT